MDHLAALLGRQVSRGLDVVAARARQAGATVDRGASALELAIIAAVLVLAASVIGALVYNIVQEQGAELERCANVPVGTSCAP